MIVQVLFKLRYKLTNCIKHMNFISVSPKKQRPLIDARQVGRCSMSY